MGTILGSAGAVIGGLLWIFIAGIAMDSLVFILTPSLLAVIFIAGVILGVLRSPDAWIIIVGILIMALTAVNFVFINLLFTQIPDSIWGIDTSKNANTLIQLNIFLGIFSFWGIFSLILGFYKKRKNKVQEK